MISLTLDRPALELIDSGAAQVDEPAVERSLIDSLVEAAVAGDVAARDRLLAELYPLVLRYCRGRIGHRESAKASAADVAQEVCLAVVATLASYKITGRSFRAFVYAIAAHKVTDAFRAIGRDRTVPVAELPDGPVLQDGPEQRLLAEELGEQLGRLLQQLTPRQREILILRIAVGLSTEETAEAVGSTPGAVRVTQHRALSRLRALVCPPTGPAMRRPPTRHRPRHRSTVPPRNVCPYLLVDPRKRAGSRSRYAVGDPGAARFQAGRRSSVILERRRHLVDRDAQMFAVLHDEPRPPCPPTPAGRRPTWRTAGTSQAGDAEPAQRDRAHLQVVTLDPAGLTAGHPRGTTRSVEIDGHHDRRPTSSAETT